MILKPCLPPAVVAEAEASEQRKEEALKRLMATLEGVPIEDPFVRAMESLIDADKRVVNLRKRR
jgi:hypothetical protein